MKFLLFHLICHIYTKQVILIHVSKLLKYHIFIIHPIHINNDIKFILIRDILKGLAKTTLQSFFAIYTIIVSNIISILLYCMQIRAILIYIIPCWHPTSKPYISTSSSNSSYRLCYKENKSTPLWIITYSATHKY